MIEIKENINLGDFCTLKIGGNTKYFIEVRSKEDLKEAYSFALNHKLQVFILGTGSNIVFPEDDFNGATFKIEIPGFEIISEDENEAIIKIGAGEKWDNIVKKTVETGLQGIECMSFIPGTSGATPIQNVGAFGQEIADTLVELEAFDKDKQELVIISNLDCKFGYRDSRFKSKDKGKFIITSITLKLKKNTPPTLTYSSLVKYLESKGLQNPTLQQVRESVIELRNMKLPDPNIIPNVGSFFENPLIERDELLSLQKRFPNIISFEMSDGKYKLFAGWLIEQAGFKGFKYKRLQISPDNALVITNPDHASRVELEELKDLIITTVEDKFGVMLETEPEFVRW
jgi:UDP-N-acetylmuramate dehydrogenase